MKYSILGFDQREVLNLTRIEMVNNKPTEVSIDIIDLLILSDVAELSNRNSIRKVILDNGQFSWISYNAILEDLPILKIEKKQLSRRLDKLESFGLIEMKVERVKGMGTFTYIRVGSKYESVKYSNDGQKSREGVVNNVYGGSQECPPKYTYTIQDNNKHKEEIDKSISQKDELFEECWKAYRRKGHKCKSKPYWDKLKNEERQRVLQHIKAYISTRDINFQKDFERYLKDKTFDSIVVKGNNVVYDPTCETEAEYHPYGNTDINYSEQYKCYIYIGYFNGTICDGYTDENRPDGATVRLNNARGTITWNKVDKKWILKKI